MTQFRWLVIVIFALAFAVVVMYGDDQPVIPVEQFVPSAGYHFANERSRIDTGAAIAGNAAPMVVRKRGVRRVPVILLRFKDTKTVLPKEDYQALLFSPPPSVIDPPRMTLSQYYRDMSGEEWEIQGDVVGWFDLPQNAAYYEHNWDSNGDGVPELRRNGIGPRLAELLEFGLKEADQVLDFGNYDNDGDDGAPNSGDDDGKVDTVIFIHAKRGFECDKRYTDLNIRSHSSQFNSPETGRTKPYVTNDVENAKKGQPAPLDEKGDPKRIVIVDYTLQPALSCEQRDQIIEIGVFCHEYGHALGLPDLYDRTPTSGPDSFGIGNYCVMAGGKSGADAQNPTRPVWMSAWPRVRLGWAPVERIESGTLTFEPVQVRRKAYFVEVPGTGGQEYFLIELRKREWFDVTGRTINWDSELKSSGLAIWHVDERVGRDQKEKPWPFAPLNKGQNDAVSYPAEKGFMPQHALVALVQADRALNLERRQNAGDEHDLWTTGGDLNDDAACVAGTRGYDGNASGLRLHGIDLVNYRLEAEVPEPVAVQEPRPEVTVAMAPQLNSWFDSVPAMSYAETMSYSVDRIIPYSAATKAFTMVGADLGDYQAEVSRDADDIDREKQAEKIFRDAVERLLNENLSNPRDGIHIVGRTRLRRFSDLDVPAKSTVANDARRRVLREYKDLFGKASLREEDDDSDGSDTVRRFDQYIIVNGEDLPIFDKSVTLYYRERSLRTIDSDIVDPAAFVVTGDNQALTTVEAYEIAQRHLGADAESITGIREGVLVDATSGDTRGRVVYEVRLKIAADQRDLRLYIDEARGDIYAIR